MSAYDQMDQAGRELAAALISSEEAAYGHMILLAFGKEGAESNETLFWLATPGSHEVSLHEYMYDFRLTLAGFYEKANVKAFQCSLLASGCGDRRTEEIMRQAVKLARQTANSLEKGYSGQSKRLLWRSDPDRERRISELRSMQADDARLAVREFKRTGPRGVSDEAKELGLHLHKALTGRGLPRATTKMDYSVPWGVRVDGSTQEKWPSRELVDQVFADLGHPR